VKEPVAVNFTLSSFTTIVLFETDPPVKETFFSSTGLSIVKVTPSAILITQLVHFAGMPAVLYFVVALILYTVWAEAPAVERRAAIKIVMIEVVFMVWIYLYHIIQWLYQNLLT